MLDPFFPSTFPVYCVLRLQESKEHHDERQGQQFAWSSLSKA